MSYLEDTRPEKDPSHNDPVHPGEQWFFYWKTSAALWESKITQIPIHEIVFIPLFWGFHAEAGMEWDFGRIHPERDLLRLTKLLTQHGRKFCWLLPLTPAPFLPNGGVPAHVARTLSLNNDGIHLAVLDQEDKLNKIFSYFDPKVYQTFSSFLRSLGKFLADANIEAPLWGAEFSYLEDSANVSYLSDTSVAFEQGFSRYLKQNSPEGNHLQDPEEEQRLKDRFSCEVQALFATAAQEALAPFWSGIQSINCLGGSPKETIERSLQAGKPLQRFFQDLFFNYVHGRWISSCLLNQQDKKDLLVKLLSEHWGTQEVETRYHYQVIHRELNQDFRPYTLVDIFDKNGLNNFEKTGLVPFLGKNFRWMYQVHEELPFNPEWIDAKEQTIKFFHGASLDRTKFSQMMKLFMMGHRVVLDRTGLHQDLDKRLQVFNLENNLKTQSVNFLTPIHISELGEGRFITFEGQELEQKQDKHKFWQHLFQYFNLNQPLIMSDPEVFSLWRIRATSPHELNYLDVRRVNMYNPTSYKKNVTIHTQKHFAFMKMIDPLKATAKSTSQGVEVELLPNGKIALDFGHYEER